MSLPYLLALQFSQSLQHTGWCGSALDIDSGCDFCVLEFVGFLLGFFPKQFTVGFTLKKKRGVHRLARACSVGRGLGVAWAWLGRGLGVAWAWCGRGLGVGVAWAWRGRGLGVAWAWLGRGLGVAWARLGRGRGLGVAWAWLGRGVGVAWAWLGRGVGVAWARLGRGRGLGVAWAWLGRGVGVAWAWLGRGVGAAWAWAWLGRGVGVAWAWRGRGLGVAWAWRGRSMGCFSGAVAHVLWGQRHWLPPPPPPPTTKTISPGVIPNSVLEFHSGTPWMKRFWKKFTGLSTIYVSLFKRKECINVWSCHRPAMKIQQLSSLGNYLAVSAKSRAHKRWSCSLFLQHPKPA